MPKTRLFLFLFLLLLANTTFAQWIEFSDVTPDWLSLGSDPEEKDVAVADLNRDGLDDVVVVRKVPFSNMGARPDLLLINTGSELEDQTTTYAPEFISNPSDARDVFIGDFDGDDWPDVIIANTFEDQPIFYHNLGEDMDGNWLGLADESSERFPLPLNIDPLQFCALWGGDVTGDDAPDLYFSNYDPNGVTSDILLINDGNGYFTDETVSRLGDLKNSAFGTSVEIHDMDNDGDNDIVKISTLFHVPPWNDNGVFLLFNDGTGNFTNWHKIHSEKPYMFTVGDLNNDDKLDVYVVDDDQDYVNYAGTIIPDQVIEYTQVGVSDPRTFGFGGNVRLADLDNDDYLDLGIADVDVDIPPCENGNTLRKFSLMKNTVGTLTAPYGDDYYPWNESTFDFGFIDVNGDDLLDLFLARCTEYKVFINEGDPTSCEVTINGGLDLCESFDDLTVLTATAGLSAYSWSSGQTTQSITVNSPGEYCVSATDNTGCEATACVTVVEHPSPVTNLNVEICEGEIYMVGSSEYTEAGQYTDVLISSLGCDSIVNLNLTVNPVYFEIVSAFICDGGSYQIADQVFMDPGEYLVSLLSSQGCDSIILLQLGLTETLFTNISAEICEGEEYEVGDEVFTTTGDYSVTLMAESGCDSVVNLQLQVNEVLETNLVEEVCEGDLIIIGGLPFDETGNYSVTLTAQGGCDSIVNLDLTVIPPEETFQTMQVCEGEEVMVGDEVFSDPGDYTVTLPDTETGCDSIVYLELLIYETPVTSLEETICAGASVTIGEETFSAEGEYEVNLLTVNGCDSIVQLSLDVLPVQETSLTETICLGDSYQVGDMIFTEEGNYEVVLTAENGCDSTVLLELEVLLSPVTGIETEICNGESYPVGDQVFEETGLYEVVLTAANGCDSTVFLDLTVNGPQTALSLSICEGEVVEMGGEVFEETGLYEILFPQEEGCDSLVILDLLVFETSEMELDEVICYGDTLMINGNSYTESGQYTEVFTDINGCDSIVVIDLTVFDQIQLLDTIIVHDTGGGTGSITVELPLSNYAYLWSTGDMTPSITDLTVGEYGLTVTDVNGCTAAFTFIVELENSVDEAGLKDGITIDTYPNPFVASTFLRVKNAPVDDKTLQVFDAAGKMMYQYTFHGNQFEFKDSLPAGVYLFRIEQGGVSLGTLKIVKIE